MYYSYHQITPSSSRYYSFPSRQVLSAAERFISKLRSPLEGTPPLYHCEPPFPSKKSHGERKGVPTPLRSFLDTNEKGSFLQHCYLSWRKGNTYFLPIQVLDSLLIKLKKLICELDRKGNPHAPLLQGLWAAFTPDFACLTTFLPCPLEAEWPRRPSLRAVPNVEQKCHIPMSLLLLWEEQNVVIWCVCQQHSPKKWSDRAFHLKVVLCGKALSSEKPSETLLSALKSMVALAPSVPLATPSKPMQCQFLSPIPSVPRSALELLAPNSLSKSKHMERFKSLVQTPQSLKMSLDTLLLNTESPSFHLEFHRLILPYSSTPYWRYSSFWVRAQL